VVGSCRKTQIICAAVLHEAKLFGVQRDG